jgi:hypothetical protein
VRYLLLADSIPAWLPGGSMSGEVEWRVEPAGGKPVVVATRRAARRAMSRHLGKVPVTLHERRGGGDWLLVGRWRTGPRLPWWQRARRAASRRT